MIVSLFLWTKHHNVTDKWTDRETDGQNSSGYYRNVLMHKKQQKVA